MINILFEPLLQITETVLVTLKFLTQIYSLVHQTLNASTLKVLSAVNASLASETMKQMKECVLTSMNVQNILDCVIIDASIIGDLTNVDVMLDLN